MKKLSDLLKGTRQFKPFSMFPRASERKQWEELPENLKTEITDAGNDFLKRGYSLLLMSEYRNFTQNGNQTVYDGKYFSRRHAVASLTIGECVEHRGRYLDKLADGILLICEESGWQVPAHNKDASGEFAPIPDAGDPVLDLFACETGGLLSMISYLLGEELDSVTPLIRKRIACEIRRRIIIPYRTGHYFWMGYPGVRLNNWTPWCTQNVLIAALPADFLTDEEKLDVLKRAADSLDLYMEGYAEDGACDEGAGYYRVGPLCYMGALEFINHVTDGSCRELYKEEKLKRMVNYIEDMHIGGSFYANYADCAPVLPAASAREFLFARRLGLEGLMNHAARDRQTDGDILLKKGTNLYYKLLNLFEDAEMRAYGKKARPVPAIREDAWYKSLGLLTARDGTFFLAVKAGGNNDNHNHNDTGSVIIYKNGKPLAIDVGPGTYFGDTFSDRRYTLWYLSSSHHNVASFGRHVQMAGEAYRARMEEVSLNQEKAFVRMELKGCYEKEAVSSYIRTVEFIKNNRIKVQDFCKGHPKGSFITYMTAEPPAVFGDGKTVAVGNLGNLEIEGAKRIETEKIALTDPKLIMHWKEALYRIRIYLKDSDCACVTTAFIG